jgi:hypothetical protein
MLSHERIFQIHVCSLSRGLPTVGTHDVAFQHVDSLDVYNLCKQICSTKQYIIVLVKSPTLSSTELSTFPQEKCGSWDLSSSKPNHDLELHVVASREDSSHNLLYVRRKSRDDLCGL